MAKGIQNAISPTREENYPEWYQQVVRAADLAENSPTRGCMVIKPWGYALWENLQRRLDLEFKKQGAKNAYFPLLIPKSFLEKEAQHVEGFAKECAVVTHSRLELNEDGHLVPASELEEPLIVRPTSETIIGDAFSRWVQSYRDLPLLINQWANVFRWEMRTRLFLRTAEFLWQEGHTVHATAADAEAYTRRMLQVYADFCREYLALPVIQGRKTAAERFPGAVDTLAIEAMMQDRKSLQAGTSHFLGQNFAKSSDIRFLSDAGKEEYAWTTSWGVSTRLIGGLIMAHGDDDGFICPPRLAPSHIAILPVTPKEETRAAVLEACQTLADALRQKDYHGEPIRVEVDDRDIRGGEKSWSWVKNGVPLRVEIGPRDLEKNAVFVGRRDRGPKEKESYSRDDFINRVPSILDEMHDTLYQRALDFQETHTRVMQSKDDFYSYFESEEAGFAIAPYVEDPAVETELQEKFKVTARCIPFDAEADHTCIFSGKSGAHPTVFGRSY